MNKAGTFMFIVNQPAGAEEYFQVVKVSICSNPDQECGEGELFSSVPTTPLLRWDLGTILGNMISC